MLKVALFDDDESFAQEVVEYFLRDNIEILHFSDGSYASVLNWRDFGCVILDLEMPSVDGRAVLRCMPQVDRPLVLIVSSHGELNTRLSLLEAGADFYITKPVDVEELATLAKKNIFKVDSCSEVLWRLDANKLLLTSPNGRSVILSMTEKNILEVLMSAPKITIPKHELFSVVCSPVLVSDERGAKRVEVALSRLRSKFRKSGDVLPVKSVRNVGYVFLEAAEVAK
jgi:DNA-binding response OmpR family regulator